MEHEAAVGERGDRLAHLVDRLAAGAAQALEVERAGVVRGTDEEEVGQLYRSLLGQAFDDQMIAHPSHGGADVDRLAGGVEDPVGEARLGVDGGSAAFDRYTLGDAGSTDGFDYQGHVRSRLLGGRLG
ncbi:MAG: hypothetical protein M9951_06835 [Burkholderiaceae bacterium]|nr:hypothetical protein [Burkholderiaceae bacterium]